MAINQIGGVRSDINDMLSKIREISNRSNVFADHSTVSVSTATSKTANFQDTMNAVKDVVVKVNTLQNESDTVKNAYLMGDKNVSMSQVLVASQKSKLAFEGFVAVRNKILDAYKEIMNMPV